MKLLLDTHFVLDLVGDRDEGSSEPDLLEQLHKDNTYIVSVVSLWEAEIKERMGKLRLLLGVKDWPRLLGALDVPIVSLTMDHVFADIRVELGHRDPFDRALVCTAAAEGCLLLTRNRMLQGHPYVWKSFLL